MLPLAFFDMATLTNVTIHGVEAITPNDGVKAVMILGRGVGKVWLSVKLHAVQARCSIENVILDI